MNSTARTVGFKPGERNIFFHILTACNLACRHCYINKEQHGTRQLTREQMEQWMALFADPTKKSNMIFLGGEPTLHPDLPFSYYTDMLRGLKAIRPDIHLKCFTAVEIAFFADLPDLVQLLVQAFQWFFKFKKDHTYLYLPAGVYGRGIKVSKRNLI